MKKKNPKNKDLIGKQKYTVSDSNSEWVLYHNNFSLCSRKVRICLEEYKIDYLPVHYILLRQKIVKIYQKIFLKLIQKQLCQFYYITISLFMSPRTNKIFNGNFSK